MTTVSNGTKISANEPIDEEEEIQIPLKKQTKQVLTERMLCEVHSSPTKREEIRYINLAFIARNRPEFYRTFLCSVCFNEIKKKSPNDLGKIKSVRRFQEKYIESVFEKYSDDKPFQDTSNLLEKAELQLCNGIDSLNQRFNECCEGYKKNIKEIFQTLRKPLDTPQVRQFIEGKLNEGMVEDFYKNYQLVNKYQVLIGNENQKVLQGVYKGFNASIEKIQQETVKELNASLIVFKQYICTYSQLNKQEEKTQKTERMIPENQEKKSVPSSIEGKRTSEQRRFSKIEAPSLNKTTASSHKSAEFSMNRIKSNQEKENQENVRNKRKIEEPPKRRMMREDSSSDESSSDDSDSSDNSSNSENQKRFTNRGPKEESKRRDQKQMKHKRQMIQKQSKAKPFRNQRVYMIDEEFLNQSKTRGALYIVIKANTIRSGSERVHRMEVEEFKKRYPMAFNRYVQQRASKK